MPNVSSLKSGQALKTIFMGSPRFVVPVLEKLVESSAIDVVLVVTQPSDTPVKKRAQELGSEIYAPDSLKNDNRLAACCPDLIIVSAYGKLIPKEILDLPKYGCLNIHPSLLPKYRGPSPGQAAILADEKVSGVTVMLVDEGFDTGPILAQKEIPLASDETAESFYDKAFREGVGLLLGALPRYVEYKEGNKRQETRDKEGIFIPPKPQDHSKATYSEKFTRESGEIGWSKSDVEIERMIRAFYPWPGAWSTVKELVSKFYVVSSEERSDKSRDLGDFSTSLEMTGKRGEKRIKILKAHLDENDRLVVDQLQIEGKKPISWEEFERGYLVRTT